MAFGPFALAARTNRFAPLLRTDRLPGSADVKRQPANKRRACRQYAAAQLEPDRIRAFAERSGGATAPIAPPSCLPFPLRLSRANPSTGSPNPTLAHGFIQQHAARDPNVQRRERATHGDADGRIAERAFLLREPAALVSDENDRRSSQVRLPEQARPLRRSAEDLPPALLDGYMPALLPSLEQSDSMRAWGSRYARMVYERCQNNKRQACRELGISYHTLQAYLRYKPERLAGLPPASREGAGKADDPQRCAPESHSGGIPW